MDPLSLQNLATIIDGTLSPDADANGCVTGGAIDSRRVQPRDIFFAMPGSKSHGIAFSDAAADRGAACMVVDASAGDVRSQRLPMIRVANVASALHKLADQVRRHARCCVIGITGSVGKTTTRQMLTAALQSRYRCIQSPANFNNELGVPLSLLQIDSQTEFAILELAACRRGDIRTLAALVRPHWSIVTRVAEAHLSSFGTVENIRLAKQELVEAIAADGQVILNADDPATRSMAPVARGHVTLAGTHEEAAVRATGVTHADGWSQCLIDGTVFRWRGGTHLVTAVTATIACTRLAGLDDATAVEAMSAFTPEAGRGAIVCHEPWLVIDESYNASPASVVAAIQSLCERAVAGPRVLVLGDMLELGDPSDELHRQLAAIIVASSIDRTFLIGTHCEALHDELLRRGVSPVQSQHFERTEDLQTALLTELKPGSTVLVKASRGMALDSVVRHLCSKAQVEHSN